MITTVQLVPPTPGNRPCLDKPAPEGDCAFASCRYARVDFTWGLAGLIGVVARFVAIPDITLKSSSNSIDQTVLAAFVLLVLLTAAQAGLLIYSVFHGSRASSSVYTMIQASVLRTQMPPVYTLCAVYWNFPLVVATVSHALRSNIRGAHFRFVDAADGARTHAALSHQMQHQLVAAWSPCLLGCSKSCWLFDVDATAAC